MGEIRVVGPPDGRGSNFPRASILPRCSIDGRARGEARGGPRDEENARSHGCSTRDPLVNRGSPRSSEFPVREVPGSWESPRDIPKRAEGQNPTPVGEGVLPHPLNNFPPRLVFYSNSFTFSIRTVVEGDI